MELNFIYPLWGAEYIKYFLEITLPMEINNNFSRLLTLENKKLIYISIFKKDLYLFKNKKILEKLKKYCDIEFVYIDEALQSEQVHFIMNKAYEAAIKKINIKKNNKILFFLTPDSFWNQNAFSYAVNKIFLGWEAVLGMGIRFDREVFSRNLDKIFRSCSDEIPLYFKSKAYLHGMTRALCINEDKFLNSWPSHIYWIYSKKTKDSNQDEFGIIAKCFHVHPLCVAWKNTFELGASTVDGDLLEKCKIPIEKQSFEEFSSVYAIELTGTEKNWNAKLEKCSIKKIRNFFASKSVTKNHCAYFKKKQGINVTSTKEVPFFIKLSLFKYNVLFFLLFIYRYFDKILKSHRKLN